MGAIRRGIRRVTGAIRRGVSRLFGRRRASSGGSGG